MPNWTGAEFAKKSKKLGAKPAGAASAAADQANAIWSRVKSRGGTKAEADRIAIATALKHANMGMKPRKMMEMNR